MSFLLPDEIKYNKEGNKTKNVIALRTRYGGNNFTKKPRKTFFRQFLSAFGDPLIKILLVALALNVIISIHNADIYEPLGIAIALFLATFVSTLSEYGSESAFLKLEEQSANIQCRVMRDGKIQTVNISELVAFDLVYISSGERIPADGIIIDGKVSVDQSALNGESVEVSKTVDKPVHNWDIKCKNQLFRGSVVTSGECIMAVGRTGDNTLYGSVASEIQEGTGKSPLTEKLSALASVLAKIGYLAAVLVFIADLFNSVIMDNNFDTACIMAEVSSLPQMVTNLLHAITLAITVVVVAIPEGLPMMITVVLSSNMQRLKKDNVLVRKLVGIETGGSVNMLFCDKTGTLTKGKLSVTAFYDKDGKEYKSVPDFCKGDIEGCCVLCNESVMINKKAVGGNATDRALLNFAYKAYISYPDIKKRIPFDSAKKYAAVQSGSKWYIKGAPEVIFKNCKEIGDNLKTKLKHLTSSGVRVLALATSDNLKEYNLVGLVAINDSLRPDVKRSVKTVQDAGINVCMVTGDNADTAKSIATLCGILKNDGVMLTSEKMQKMSDSELIKILPRLQVVARALPQDKSRLVRLSKKAGLVCGMTGDGINDAPALKQADVGFAMGSGTEVAKQAGDIVILDDNFTSISKAILYGRTIFKSIRKFIVFQLTMNLCAVGISLIGPFIGVDTPITVMQMLWINIIMDTLAGLAFAGEMPIIRYMKEKPISRKEPVLSKSMTAQIMSMGIYNLVMCTVFLTAEYFKKHFGFYTNSTKFMTSFFALFIFSGVFGALNARSESRNVFYNLFKNKTFVVIFTFIILIQLWLIYYGGVMFRTSGITTSNLLFILGMSFSVVPFDLIRKTVFKIIKNY